jgi:hypothetical protein
MPACVCVCVCVCARMYGTYWHLQVLLCDRTLPSRMASPIQTAAKVDEVAAGGL